MARAAGRALDRSRSQRCTHVARVHPRRVAASDDSIPGQVSGAEFRRIRRDLALTQAQMAVKMDVSRATVNRWENSKQPLRGPAAVLARLLAVLGR